MEPFFYSEKNGEGGWLAEILRKTFSRSFELTGRSGAELSHACVRRHIKFYFFEKRTDCFWGEGAEKNSISGTGLLCVIIMAALVIMPLAAYTAEPDFDLERIKRDLQIRYYISENNQLPPGYILLDDKFIYPSFLDVDTTRVREVVEYDPGTRLIFSFRVPGDRYFHREEKREGPFYSYVPRDIRGSEVTVDIQSMEQRGRKIWDKALRKTWAEEVEYLLKTQREVKGGRGGLLSIDIPVPLPDQVEAIIGDGEATNLTVRGREEITIGGQSRWCSNCPQSETRQQDQKFPDLDMEQNLSVDLHGNIGEKINVEIRHSSSKGVGTSTNDVRINYRGFEDDVVKLIEMGNTDLTMSGAQLISYSGSAKGLFGVKGMAELGPLALTVIASKEEGETASGTFNSQGGQMEKVGIKDVDFVRRQFFYFECPGPDFSPGYQGGSFFNTFPVIDEDDDIFVFESDQNKLVDYPQYWIKAYQDPENNGLEDNSGVDPVYPKRRYRELTREDNEYDFIRVKKGNENRYVGIKLANPLPDNKSLVIIYKSENTATNEFHKVGDYNLWKNGNISTDSTATYTAELICPVDVEFSPDESSGYHHTWNMMMRNVYYLGIGQLKKQDDDYEPPVITIEEDVNRQNPDIHPQSGLNFIRIFGLDSFNRNNQTEGKDGLVDDKDYIILPSGYLMFPYFEPFNPTPAVLASVLDSTEYNDMEALDSALVKRPDMYDQVLSRTEMDDYNYYSIMVESSGGGQRTFQLNAFDIIEGSEVVTVDGTRLSRGVDYKIDYTTGVVTLTGDILYQMTANSKVSIDYQHKPIMGGGKKSLLGVGAELNLSQDARINGTFLYNSVGASRYRPRLGEEPHRVMAADINGSFNFRPGWMTGLVNLLPRVDTDKQSSINIGGEVALSMPNPNTKGEAYVDDMEGIEESDRVTLIRKSWYEASPPAVPDSPDSVLMPGEDVDFYWYNPTHTTENWKQLVVSKRDLNPELDERENATSSSIVIHPVKPERDWNSDDWVGIMTGFPGGIDLTTAQYLEIWVNDFRGDETGTGGKLHIDFGDIDEDFYKPARQIFNQEDRDLDGWTRLADDRGFDENDDCIFTMEEDSWNSELNVYENINCRSQNGVEDTEDLNRNDILDRVNSYYTLTIDLSEEAIIDVRRDFPEGEPRYSDYWNNTSDGYNSSWRMYRIDLSNAGLTGTEPRMDAIQHMRIRVSGLDSLGARRGKLVQLTGLKFVGNKWLFDGLRDLDGRLLADSTSTDVTVGIVNNKETPEIYSSPYEVEEEEGIANREQSLLFEFTDLDSGMAFQSMKRYFGQGQDYSQYRELQFFLQHSEGLTGGEFYFRIAYDSLNYYEVSVPLRERYEGRWILAIINLADLTNLKVNAGDSMVVKTISDVVATSRSYTAKLVGNPSLFKVKRLFAGARNTTGHMLSEGRLFFNDIRLGGVRKDVDHAERVNVSANFGGVLQLNGSWRRRGAEFRSLNQSAGSGVVSSSYSFNGKTRLGYFIPTGGFVFPISAKYNVSKSLPKYLPSSDVEIKSEAVKDSLRSVNNNYSLSISMSRKGSQNFLMKHLFDNLRTGFTYSKRSVYNPSTRDTTRTMSGNLNYDVHFSNDRKVNLFGGIKWRYWLSNLSFRSSASREVRETYSLRNGIFDKRPTRYSAGWNNSMSTVYEPFRSIKLDFNMREKRNLGIDHDFHGIPIGVQTSFGHSFKMTVKPPPTLFLIGELNPTFDYSTHYSENIRPTVRQGDDPFGTRNADLSRDMGFFFDLDMGKYLLDLGKYLNIIEDKQFQRAKSRATGSGSSKSSEEKLKQLMEKRNKKMSDSKPGEKHDIPVEGHPGGGEEQEEEAAGDEGGFRDLGLDGRRRKPQKEEEKPGEGEQEEAGADTTVGEEVDYMLLPRKMIKFISRVEPVKTHISMRRNSNYNRIYDRANFWYQFGLSDQAGVPGKSGDIEREPERLNDNIMISFNTGLNLSSTADVEIKYSMTRGRSVINKRETETERITWPSLNLRWDNVGKIGFLKRYLENSNLRMKFERKTRKDVRGEEVIYTVSPNWDMSWKNDMSTNLSFSYRHKNKYEGGDNLWDKGWSVDLNAKYDFEGKKGIGLPLPFLGDKKMKFESTLRTNLNVGYARTTKYNQPPATTFSLTPRATYKFSNKIKGSLSFNYKRTAGGPMGLIYNTVGLHVTGEFTF